MLSIFVHYQHPPVLERGPFQAESWNPLVALSLVAVERSGAGLLSDPARKKKVRYPKNTNRT